MCTHIIGTGAGWLVYAGCNWEVQGLQSHRAVHGTLVELLQVLRDQLAGLKGTTQQGSHFI